MRDIFFLWRQKRNLIVMMLIGVLPLIAASFVFIYFKTNPPSVNKTHPDMYIEYPAIISAVCIALGYVSAGLVARLIQLHRGIYKRGITPCMMVLFFLQFCFVFDMVFHTPGHTILLPTLLLDTAGCTLLCTSAYRLHKISAWLSCLEIELAYHGIHKALNGLMDRRVLDSLPALQRDSQLRQAAIDMCFSDRSRHITERFFFLITICLLMSYILLRICA